MIVPENRPHHERPTPGPACRFAADLRAALPTLTTDRLYLRPPTLMDFDVWAEIFCGPAGPWLGGPFTRDDAFTEFCAAMGLWPLRGFGPWAVTLKDPADGDAACLGFVLIGFEPGDPEPELGFLFRPSAEGYGYGAEAARAARAHAFGALDLASVVSMIDPANTRALALARRLGAVRTGTIDGAEIWRHNRDAA